MCIGDRRGSRGSSSAGLTPDAIGQRTATRAASVTSVDCLVCPQSGNYSGCQGRDVHHRATAATLSSSGPAFNECLCVIGMGATTHLTGDFNGG